MLLFGFLPVLSLGISHRTHIHGITAADQLIIEDVFHQVCLLDLTKAQPRIAQADIRSIVLDGRIQIGLAFDGAVQYTHRTSELYTDDPNGTSYKRNYIEVPIHAKYKLGLPVLEKVAVPFLFVGPNFAFLTNSNDKGNSFKDKDMALSLDLGAGVELVHKLQVSVTYSAGMTKAFEYVGVDRDKYPNVTGKDKCWTIAAAYFF